MATDSDTYHPYRANIGKNFLVARERFRRGCAQRTPHLFGRTTYDLVNAAERRFLFALPNNCYLGTVVNNTDDSLPGAITPTPAIERGAEREPPKRGVGNVYFELRDIEDNSWKTAPACDWTNAEHYTKQNNRSYQKQKNYGEEPLLWSIFKEINTYTRLIEKNTRELSLCQLPYDRYLYQEYIIHRNAIAERRTKFRRIIDKIFLKYPRLSQRWPHARIKQNWRSAKRATKRVRPARNVRPPSYRWRHAHVRLAWEYLRRIPNYCIEYKSVVQVSGSAQAFIDFCDRWHLCRQYGAIDSTSATPPIFERHVPGGPVEICGSWDEKKAGGRCVRRTAWSPQTTSGIMLAFPADRPIEEMLDEARYILERAASCRRFTFGVTVNEQSEVEPRANLHVRYIRILDALSDGAAPKDIWRIFTKESAVPEMTIYHAIDRAKAIVSGNYYIDIATLPAPSKGALATKRRRP